uniref:Integrase n=1 Tax=Heterorhabditis bacteriophora TaxID=37862 RepID=A0A1I7WC62_HETBA
MNAVRPLIYVVRRKLPKRVF